MGGRFKHGWAIRFDSELIPNWSVSGDTMRMVRVTLLSSESLAEKSGGEVSPHGTAGMGEQKRRHAVASTPTFGMLDLLTIW